MTRLFLISAFCGGLILPAHAQSINTWIEQLAALQTLGNTIRQEYRTVTGGLRTIGDIRVQEYRLHSAWMDSLGTVRMEVLDDPKTGALRVRLEALQEQIRSAIEYWRQQPIR
jgi:hypothetical protein